MVEPRRRLTMADLVARRSPTVVPIAPPPDPAPAPVFPDTAKRARQPSRWAKIRAEFGSETINHLIITFTQRWSATFSTPPRPLARGIHREIMAAMNADPQAIALALRDWTHRRIYLQALAAGGPRYGLEGTETGDVSETERTQAIHALAAREAPAKAKHRAGKSSATS